MKEKVQVFKLTTSNVFIKSREEHFQELLMFSAPWSQVSFSSWVLVELLSVCSCGTLEVLKGSA